MSNKMFITGRLTADPEVRYGGANNTAIARFTLASQRNYKDKDGNYVSDFIKCIAFGKTAEVLEKYGKKGVKLIVIDGEFQNNNYTNKDGQKVYDYQVAVSTFEFAESKSGNAGSNSQGSSNASQNQSANESSNSFNDDFMNFSELVDEELPFN